MLNITKIINNVIATLLVRHLYNSFQRSTFRTPKMLSVFGPLHHSNTTPQFYAR